MLGEPCFMRVLAYLRSIFIARPRVGINDRNAFTRRIRALFPFPQTSGAT